MTTTQKADAPKADAPKANAPIKLPSLAYWLAFTVDGKVDAGFAAGGNIAQADAADVELVTVTNPVVNPLLQALIAAAHPGTGEPWDPVCEQDVLIAIAKLREIIAEINRASPEFCKANGVPASV
jgi:hypothetical protein